MGNNPIIIHIPHSSTYIPDDELNQILLSDAELQKEVLIMTDLYTDELFDVQSCERHINSISRLVMDPERFRSDDAEEMSCSGMGAIYLKTSEGKSLKIISQAEREEKLKRYYDPYHHTFTKKVASHLKKWNKCLIIDAHSFSSKPLPHEKEKSEPRPNVCIGTDNFHTPQELAQLTYEFFNKRYDKVYFNKPFVGTIVPMNFYYCNKNVQSIMIEINRSLYMDEVTGLKLLEFERVKRSIEEYIENIAKSMN